VAATRDGLRALRELADDGVVVPKGMRHECPLSVPLSQALVALTIELDNEHEARMAPTWANPFKTSYVMWANLLRWVPAEGTTVGQVAKQTAQSSKALASTVGGMERWGYLLVDDDRGRAGFGSARGVKPGTTLTPSMTGTLVHEKWGPLPAEIESRWRSRLGEGTVEELRDAARAIGSRIDAPLPPSMPVVQSRGLWCADAVDHDVTSDIPADTLHALLSRVLLRWTLEFEATSSVSLALGANVLRVLGDDPIALKDLPLRTGVSKEAVATSVTWLEKEGHVAVESREARVTPVGKDAQEERSRRSTELEETWSERHGRPEVTRLRAALEAVLDGNLGTRLEPPAGGWRGTGRYRPLTAAFVADAREHLPHHPMILHRGGWPDGS
jgi:hypothetical protein